ncbi:LysR family transcriptional regulator [Plastoroseomonas hellenica]|uniref:LysR family transcriptional regulator n=1 Tax=Plastoroseomonas hellenica TaxID=2687306 RepID=UPI001BA51F4B|nr:LysR family transcriptional regulator [Plastoroseomonas hellenica]MBR0645483.1 LysR family transcriptional regulator [Plastoroseomonas hellenica]
MAVWRLDLVSLDLFLSVADEGSIAAAAERKNIAASAVSRRLQELELQMDTPLVLRHARGVKLTPAGEALHRHAASVFELLSRIRDEMGEHARGARGHIRIATNSSALVASLPEELARYAERFPGIRLEIQELVSPEIERQVRDGVADLGLLGAGAPCAGLETLPYRRDRLLAVVPAGHPLAARDDIGFGEMLEFPQVGMAAGSSIQQILVEAARRLGQELDLRVTASSFDAVRRMIQAGLGIAVLPEACVEPYERVMGLVGVKLRDAWSERALKICVRDLRTLSAPTRLFIEMIAAEHRSAWMR